jgi:phosphosulfolactate phosphohydrolase-like enzyme
MRSLITAAVLAITATTAAAQSNCAERVMVVERLAERYGEMRQAIGLGANNSVIEVFANLESGSWTITVTMPNGTTCLVASGQSFELIEGELTPQGTAL